MLDTAKTKEETISNLVGKAEALKNESKFKESISEWKKLRDILPNNDYVVQQLALVQYKSKYSYLLKHATYILVYQQQFRLMVTAWMHRRTN